MRWPDRLLVASGLAHGTLESAARIRTQFDALCTHRERFWPGNSFDCHSMFSSCRMATLLDSRLWTSWDCRDTVRVLQAVSNDRTTDGRDDRRFRLIMRDLVQIWRATSTQTFTTTSQIAITMDRDRGEVTRDSSHITSCYLRVHQGSLTLQLRDVIRWPDD